MAANMTTGSDAEMIATAAAGAYLLVTFSDGRFEKTEEVGLRRGLFDKIGLTGLTAEAADGLFVETQSAFTADYDAAAEATLARIKALAGNGIARRAISEAARIAVITDDKITPQEENALTRLAAALGLDEGVL